MTSPQIHYFDLVNGCLKNIEANKMSQAFDPQDKQEQLILRLLEQHREKKEEYGEQASIASLQAGIQPTHYQLARIAEKLQRAVKVYTYEGIQVGDTFETLMIDIAGHALLGVAQLDS